MVSTVLHGSAELEKHFFLRSRDSTAPDHLLSERALQERETWAIEHRTVRPGSTDLEIPHPATWSVEWGPRQ